MKTIKSTKINETLQGFFFFHNEAKMQHRELRAICMVIGAMGGGGVLVTLVDESASGRSTVLTADTSKSNFCLYKNDHR